VSVHRQKNVDFCEVLARVLDYLVAVREKWGLPVMVSAQPRTRVRLEELVGKDLEAITFQETFGYQDYDKPQLDSNCLISGSGTTREGSSILLFCALTLRDSARCT
jgi:UDP-N-acetylglucosamine 2-epimerase (non-hydrolysing)